MATKDEQDTDPSTPIARSSGRRSSAPPRKSTHPGVGPPNTLRAPSDRPLGIIVPSPSSFPPASETDPGPPDGSGPKEKKDSVELLLEGMAEPRLDRRKTTPQTDGQASAAYHSEHSVQPPGPRPSDAEASVLIDRPLSPITVRVTRPRELLDVGVSDSTVVTPAHPLRGALLAALAGVCVLLALFVGAQFVKSTNRAAPVGPAANVESAVGPHPAVELTASGGSTAAPTPGVAGSGLLPAASSPVASSSNPGVPSVATSLVPGAAVSPGGSVNPAASSGASAAPAASPSSGGAASLASGSAAIPASGGSASDARGGASGLAPAGATPSAAPASAEPRNASGVVRRRARPASTVTAPADLGEFKTTY